MHPERLGVGPVDLVDGDDRPEPERQRFPGDEPGLRHRALGRVHQDQHPVHHAENPLDLAAEVRVARRVHDVDLDALPAHRGVLGQDGDPALALERVRVHHPLFHLLVGAEGPRLPQHLIHQGGLAVVDVGDDGEIPDQTARPSVGTGETRTPGPPRRIYRLGRVPPQETSGPAVGRPESVAKGRRGLPGSMPPRVARSDSRLSGNARGGCPRCGERERPFGPPRTRPPLRAAS